MKVRSSSAASSCRLINGPMVMPVARQRNTRASKGGSGPTCGFPQFTGATGGKAVPRLELGDSCWWPFNEESCNENTRKTLDFTRAFYCLSCAVRARLRKPRNGRPTPRRSCIARSAAKSASPSRSVHRAQCDQFQPTTPAPLPPPCARKAWIRQRWTPPARSSAARAPIRRQTTTIPATARPPARR